MYGSTLMNDTKIAPKLSFLILTLLHGDLHHLYLLPSSWSVLNLLFNWLCVLVLECKKFAKVAKMQLFASLRILTPIGHVMIPIHVYGLVMTKNDQKRP